MKHIHTLILCFVVILGMMLIGCSASNQTSRESTPTITEKQPDQPPAKPAEALPKVDTVSADVKDTQKPTYEPPAQPTEKPTTPVTTGMPAGQFSVQVGAYQMPDNADRVAAMAKERFAIPVYTILDPTDNMYKVRVGNFTSKDDARNFRDSMAARFPDDYKDAWVAENTQK